jgi:hypothetical protein
MIKQTGCLLLLVACCLASPAWPQSEFIPAGLQIQLRDASLNGDAMPAGDVVLLTPSFSESFLRDQFRRSDAGPLSDVYLSMYVDRFYGLRRYQLSRLDTAMQGAGVGMTAGLFLGAAGMTMGGFDEETGWYIAGAMAAIGAILGGTKGANDPEKRIRYGWDVGP